MKNFFKRTIVFIVTVVVSLSFTTISVGAVSVGSVIGYAQPTDIVATINGYQLESYNVNNLTYICVEDLRYYGFDVNFDPYARTLSFSRNYNTSHIDPQNTNSDFWSIGSNTNLKSILYTDIATGRNHGILSVLVLTGETTTADVDNAEEASKPDIMLASLAEAHQLMF